jgi:hypothetical protein
MFIYFSRYQDEVGVLTLRGDLKKSYDCNQEAIQYASTTHVPHASGEVLTVAQQLSQAGLEIPTRKANKSSIQSTGDVALKTIQLQEGDSCKTAVIGAGLGEKCGSRLNYSGSITRITAIQAI